MPLEPGYRPFNFERNMSFLKKILPFLFKEEKKKDEKKTSNGRPATTSGSGKGQPANRRPQGEQRQPAERRPQGEQRQHSERRDDRRDDRRDNSNDENDGPREQSPIVGYALIARSKNHRGLRKGSKVYVRQIFDDDERLRVRGTAPNGKKVSLTVNRHSLSDYESEGVPEHLAKHYSPDSLFQDEHEAKVKAEVMGKR